MMLTAVTCCFVEIRILLMRQVAQHSNACDQDPEHRTDQPNSKGNPAPYLRIVRSGLRSGVVAGRKLSIHLRCVDDRWNSGRKAAEHGRQDREHQIVRHGRSLRRDHSSRNWQWRGWNCRLQNPSTLHTYGCVIGVSRTTLGTEHRFLASKSRLTSTGICPNLTPRSRQRQYADRFSRICRRFMASDMFHRKGRREGSDGSGCRQFKILP